MTLMSFSQQTDGPLRTPSFRACRRGAPASPPLPLPGCRPLSALPSVVPRLLRSLLLVSLAIPLVPAAHAGAGEKTLAVLAVESGSRLDRDAAALVTAAIRREIGASGQYQVLEENRMSSLGRNRSSKFLHCASKDCAVEAGKLVGAGAVIIGTLTRSGRAYFLKLSRVDVETQTVAFIVEDKSTGETEDLLQMSRTAAKRIMGNGQLVPQRAAGPRDERFVVHEDAVFDNETKLTWMRTPDPGGKAMTWEEALDVVQRLNRMRSARYDNWRLPDKDELATLQSYANGQGVKMNLHELFTRIGFRSIRADYYWSATSSDDLPGLAWVIDLYGGGMSPADKNGKGYVWPVRTGPWLFEEPSGRP